MKGDQTRRGRRDDPKRPSVPQGGHRLTRSKKCMGAFLYLALAELFLFFGGVAFLPTAEGEEERETMSRSACKLAPGGIGGR